MMNQEGDWKRRDFLKALSLGLATSVVAPNPAFGQAVPAAQSDTAPKPNIIFILADDLGYGDLGCFGQTRIKTTNLDRLAAQGTRYTHSYAGSVVCAPSRSVLMTGLHTGHTRIRGNSGKNAPPHDGQAGRIPLHADDFTVAQLLKQAGYATGIAGKWGLGEPGSTGLPNDHGFDEWLGYLNQDHAPDYYTDYLWRNKERQPIPENRDGAQQKYSCDLFTEFAVDFVERHKDGPFFLYLPYTIPHAKLQVPDLAPYADEPWPDDAKILAAMITRLDGYVGWLLDLLDAQGIADNTIVFFASDNGSSGASLDFFQRSGPLRAKKGSLYEGGIRTPMIVRWPGHVAEGAVNDTPWYFADFLPTAGALAGVTPPTNIDGVNVLPTLLGENQPDLQDRFLYWETQLRGDLGQAVRHGAWKAVRQGLHAEIELYDVTVDIAEAVNVAADHPDVVARIDEYLRTARVDSPYWPIEPEQKPVESTG